MSCVLRILKRDAIRLIKAPAALVVMLALAVLPSLYTWFNVIGFWNPYDNTGNLRVCVVNLDEPASADIIGELDLGSQIVDTLHENTQLGWDFVDYDTAMDAVNSGSAYAAFVIPQDFSANMATILTDDFEQPQLEYYVNEKSGPVSTKITDTGATTLDQTINSTFVSTVSSVVADAFDDALTGSENAIESSRSDVDTQIDEAEGALAEARETIASLLQAADELSQKASDAQSLLGEAEQTGASLESDLSEAANLVLTAQTQLTEFSADLISALDEGSLFLSNAAAKANTAVGDAASALTSANDTLSSVLSQADSLVTENEALLSTLQTYCDALSDDDPNKEALKNLINSLEEKNTQIQDTISGLNTLNTDTGASIESIAQASDALSLAVQGNLDAAAQYRSTLSQTAFPKLNNALSQIAGVSNTLAEAIASQGVLVDEAQAVFAQLSQLFDASTEALEKTDGILSDIQSDLSDVRTDLSAVGTSDALSQLLNEVGEVDPEKIGEFMLSPTEIVTESLYPMNAYGSSMAPLFTNLTLWIGVFMLMVILRLEVDDEGIEGMRISHGYIAKWLFLAGICSIQAIICQTGNIIIGVQVENVLAFYATAIVASLAYLSIQYALSTTMQHVGKGLCVIAVFMQIPGATGLYPTEMIPPFFRAIYPFMPFTYGINALRETIGGFYGTQWFSLMGVLVVFMVGFFVLGLVVRPFTVNLNRLVAKRIRQSDILSGEEVEVPPRRYRLRQLMRALSDREEYRVHMEAHAQRFLSRYERFKYVVFALAIAVPVGITLGFSLTNAEKVVVLTMWLAWLVLIIVGVVAVEFVHDNLEHEISLEAMSDDEVRGLFRVRILPSLRNRGGLESQHREISPARSSEEPPSHHLDKSSHYPEQAGEPSASNDFTEKDSTEKDAPGGERDA